MTISHHFSGSGQSVCTVCGKALEDDEQTYCKHCYETVIYPDTDSRGRRGKWVKDFFHCPKCQKRYVNAKDQYCRYCGAKREHIEAEHFEVSPEDIELVYGPMPAIITYSCPSCGNQWKGSNWNPQTYCPLCGATAQSDDSDEFF